MSGTLDSTRTQPDFLIDGEPVQGESIFPELDARVAKVQPERERILDGMAEAMGQMVQEHAGGAASLRELADAALRALESPNRGDGEAITPCTCGHSGYSKDGPHTLGCPLA